MKGLKVLLLGVSVFLMAAPAHALFELSGHYGLNLGETDLDDAQTIDSASLPASGAMIGFGADAIVSLPAIPVGLGLRYENLGFEVSESDVSMELKFTRLALIGNYRLIDTLLFVGPIVSLGVMHDAKLTISGLPAPSERTYESDLGVLSTYSLGIEAGIKLLSFLAGMELGYGSFDLGTPTNGSEEFPTEVNASGIYAKIMLGFGF